MTDSVENICVYEAKVTAGDEFVGIRLENGCPHVYFPIGYRPSENVRELRRDILNLVSVLTAYGNRNEYKLSAHGNDSQVFPIHAYIGVFTYYLNYGYYFERETSYNQGRGGKIDWKRTIKKIHPQWSENGPLYLDYVIKRTVTDDSTLLSQIHRYCVYETYQRLGCLFTSAEPDKPTIKFNERLFTSVLQAKIAKTFNELHLTLFKQMLDIVKSLASNSDRSALYYGTNDFEYVWEGLIDQVFGISPNERKEFYPQTTWHLENNKTTNVDMELEKSALRPDSIMIYQRGETPGIFVLDAKYYRYGVTGNPMSLPGSSSINKQFTYAEYVETLDRSEGHRIYNAFIMPYNSQSSENADYGLKKIGFATGNWKQNGKSYEKIYGILLDVKSIMYSHTRLQSKAMERLAELIETDNS